jgi:hypothetical protein
MNDRRSTGAEDVGAPPHSLETPCAFLQQQLGTVPASEALLAYQSWWQTTGGGLSEAVDRAGTPWLRMYDHRGQRCDEILWGGGYRPLLLVRLPPRGDLEGLRGKLSGAELPVW